MAKHTCRRGTCAPWSCPRCQASIGVSATTTRPSPAACRSAAFPGLMQRRSLSWTSRRRLLRSYRMRATTTRVGFCLVASSTSAAPTCHSRACTSARGSVATICPRARTRGTRTTATHSPTWPTRTAWRTVVRSMRTSGATRARNRACAGPAPAPPRTAARKHELMLALGVVLKGRLCVLGGAYPRAHTPPAAYI